MQEAIWSVETHYPIAFDSIDHLQPSGTKNDNHSNIAFIEELEQRFGSPLRFMDLGCAGGLLVHDMVRRGHLAVGLEGSDYSARQARAEWPALYGTHLFTCDVSREYTVWVEEKGQKSPFLCDVITAWEVVEHIPPDRLHLFFQMIRRHLRIGGRCLASVSMVRDVNGYHQSVFPRKEWEEIFSQLDGLTVNNYPCAQVVRQDVIGTSFFIALERVH